MALPNVLSTVAPTGNYHTTLPALHTRARRGSFSFESQPPPLHPMPAQFSKVELVKRKVLIERILHLHAECSYLESLQRHQFQKMESLKLQLSPNLQQKHSRLLQSPKSQKSDAAQRVEAIKQQVSQGQKDNKDIEQKLRKRKEFIRDLEQALKDTPISLKATQHNLRVFELALAELIKEQEKLAQTITTTAGQDAFAQIKKMRLMTEIDSVRQVVFDLTVKQKETSQPTHKTSQLSEHPLSRSTELRITGSKVDLLPSPRKNSPKEKNPTEHVSFPHIAPTAAPAPNLPSTVAKTEAVQTDQKKRRARPERISGEGVRNPEYYAKFMSADSFGYYLDHFKPTHLTRRHCFQMVEAGTKFLKEIFAGQVVQFSTHGATSIIWALMYQSVRQRGKGYREGTTVVQDPSRQLFNWFRCNSDYLTRNSSHYAYRCDERSTKSLPVLKDYVEGHGRLDLRDLPIGNVTLLFDLIDVPNGTDPRDALMKQAVFFKMETSTPDSWKHFIDYFISIGRRNIPGGNEAADFSKERVPSKETELFIKVINAVKDSPRYQRKFRLLQQQYPNNEVILGCPINDRSILGIAASWGYGILSGAVGSTGCARDAKTMASVFGLSYMAKFMKGLSILQKSDSFLSTSEIADVTTLNTLLGQYDHLETPPFRTGREEIFTQDEVQKFTVGSFEKDFISPQPLAALASPASNKESPLKKDKDSPFHS